MDVDRADIKRKTASSVFWALARISFEQGFSFVVFVVLARLLTPRDMGIFALAGIFFELGRLIVGAGLPDAVIREPNMDEEFADTIFWANVGLSLIVTAVLCAVAPAVGFFFHEPTVREILWAVSSLIPISALGTIHNARKLREFGYKSVAGRVFLASLLGGVLGVVAAVQGFGAWSLVVQRAVAEVATTVLIWRSFRWIPRLRFSGARLHAVALFSFNVMLTQLAWTAMVRFQDFIVGSRLGAASVGTYRLAWRGIDLLIQFTLAPFVAIALPTLSRLQHDREGFNRALLRLNSIGALVSCPAMLGFGAIAPDAVPAIFGERWASAGAVAQILSLMVLPHVTSSLTGPVFSALGQSRTVFRLASAQLIATIVLTALAAPFGLKAVAIAYVARAYLLLPVQLHLVRKATGISLGSIFSAVAPPFFASAGMGVCVLVSLPRLEGWMSRDASLVMCVLGAGILYAGLLLAFAKTYVISQLTAFRSLRRIAPT